MGRITVDINEEWLDAAQEILGTKTKVATINEALRTFALRKKAAEIVAALNSVEMDYSGSAQAWRYGGGRDLSRIEEEVRRRLAEDVRSDDVA